MLMLFDSGALKILEKIFNGVVPAGGPDLTLHLFTNDIVPADDDILADYTEAVGGGYAPVPLLEGSWTVSVVGGIPKAVYAQQPFAFSGPLTTNPDIRGYYVTDADGDFMWAERGAAPYTPENVGDILAVTPSFQLSKGTPT